MENKKIFDESCSYMPGGVNSPVRAFKGLDTNPPVISSGSGSIIVDEEGKKLVTGGIYMKTGMGSYDTGS